MMLDVVPGHRLARVHAIRAARLRPRRIDREVREAPLRAAAEVVRPVGAVLGGDQVVVEVRVPREVADLLTRRVVEGDAPLLGTAGDLAIADGGAREPVVVELALGAEVEALRLLEGRARFGARVHHAADGDAADARDVILEPADGAFVEGDVGPVDPVPAPCAAVGEGLRGLIEVAGAPLVVEAEAPLVLAARPLAVGDVNILELRLRTLRRGRLADVRREGAFDGGGARRARTRCVRLGVGQRVEGRTEGREVGVVALDFGFALRTTRGRERARVRD